MAGTGGGASDASVAGSGGATAGIGGLPQGDAGGSGGAKADGGRDANLPAGPDGASDGGRAPEVNNAGGTGVPMPLCTSTGGVAMPTLKKVAISDKNVSGANQVIGVPGEPGLLYVLDHFGGNVWIIKDGLLQAEPLVKVNVRTTDIKEQGLLAIALSPGFATNQLFYLFYNSAADPAGHSQIDEFKRTSKTTATFVRSVYSYPHSAANHNGGSIAFGPDKMMYVSMGDNGSNGSEARKTDGRYGRILRLDAATGLGMPAPGMDGFTWSYGLRNPYRMTIDRLTGDLYIGDVGEKTTEEIDFEPNGKGALDWGWSGGNSDGRGSNAETAPIATVGTNMGAIIGGYVYRGTKIPGMCGRYFYAHWGDGNVFSFVQQGGKATAMMTHPELTVGDLSSFGEDGEGELYISSNSGTVYRIEAN